MTQPAFVPALPLSVLAPGQMRCVDIGGTPVLLARTKDGNVHAVHNICTHAHSRMDEGRLRGDRLVCALHGASFDVRSGAVLSGPATVALARYAVRIVDGQIEVQA